MQVQDFGVNALLGQGGPFSNTFEFSWNNLVRPLGKQFNVPLRSFLTQSLRLYVIILRSARLPIDHNFV